MENSDKKNAELLHTALAAVGITVPNYQTADLILDVARHMIEVGTPGIQDLLNIKLDNGTKWGTPPVVDTKDHTLPTGNLEGIAHMVKKPVMEVVKDEVPVALHDSYVFVPTLGDTEGWYRDRRDRALLPIGTKLKATDTDIITVSDNSGLKLYKFGGSLPTEHFMYFVTELPSETPNQSEDLPI